MKALMIKDLKLLKGQKPLLGMMGVLMVIFVITGRHPGFLISYMTIMGAIFAVSTISYDEYNNGLTYLFTLPVSRRKYVREKYLFSIMMSAAVAVGCLIITYAASLIRADRLEMEELVISGAAALGVGIFMVSVVLPIELKLGAEKSRAAMAVVGGVIFAVVYSGIWVMKRFGKSAEKLLVRLSSMPIAMTAGIIAVCCLVLLVVSMKISVYVLEKREF